MLTLYDNLSSGNGYKVRLLLKLLSIPFKHEIRDVYLGETRKADFLAINPVGRVPTVVFEDGRVLTESNAIMHYFASGTPYLPVDPYPQAQCLQWMFFEQYSHEPNIAVARFWLHFEDGRTRYAEQLPEKWTKGHEALLVMENHLADRAYFVASTYSIADIALYAYTHVADEGGFDLTQYPNIRAWLDRVSAQAGHIPITKADF